MNIYSELNKPIYSLAPMEDVTDSVFRDIVSKASKPDLLYTEFVNVEGLNSKGKEKVMHRLDLGNNNVPTVVQLWGLTPEYFKKSAELIKDIGFLGIDINMGCSVKKVSGRGAGSGLINNPGLAKEIIDSVKTARCGLEISVKTRLGWDTVNMDWIKFLLEQNLSALTIHMRTARGKDAITADWSYMSEIIKLRNKISPNTLIFGNGDIKDIKEAEDMVNKYGVDGVMIGRAAIFNPWVFNKEIKEITNEERFKLFQYHLELFKERYDGVKDFNGLKKFFRAYIKEFDGANELRQKFMMCNDIDECIELLKQTIS